MIVDLLPAAMIVVISMGEVTAALTRLLAAELEATYKMLNGRGLVVRQFLFASQMGMWLLAQTDKQRSERALTVTKGAQIVRT